LNKEASLAVRVPFVNGSSLLVLGNVFAPFIVVKLSADKADPTTTISRRSPFFFPLKGTAMITKYFIGQYKKLEETVRSPVLHKALIYKTISE
jgi:hypothetical protein